MDAPKKIARYEILDLLGKGAMGSVYRAWDPKLGREVALKVVAEKAKVSAKARERFHREARAIAALQHPNVVEIYDYPGEDSELLYLVMEKLDGADLWNLLNQNGAMTEDVASAIGYELCLALEVAHEAGIIHRDLKPENVLMDGAGRVVLTDFGVVKVVRQDSEIGSFESETEVVGTPGFMAPEQIMGNDLSPATDLFSLAALLYNISTGEMPFPGSAPLPVHRAIMSGSYTDPRQHRPLLSDEFCALLARCMEIDPSMRPTSALAVREGLKDVLSSHGVADWREDLREYMRAPKGHARRSREREISYLEKTLRQAVRSGETSRIDTQRQRLARLAPKSEILRELGSVQQAPAAPVRQERRRLGRSGWAFYVACGAGLGGAVGLATFFSTRRQTPASVPLAGATLPMEPASSKAPFGTLLLRIKGGTAAVELDGPGLLTRGHGRSHSGLVVRGAGEPVDAATLGDEPAMLVAGGLDVAVAACADRRLGARALVDRGCDALVLDDGFSHRRLARDLDIVVLRGDAPFDSGHLMPWGRLREPPSSLRRAALVWLHHRLTKATSVLESLRRLAPEADVVVSESRPTSPRDERGRVVTLAGARLVAAAGIARPHEFALTLEQAGAQVVALFARGDHHRYSVEDVRVLGELCRANGADAVVVTPKDHVKLAPLWLGPPLWVLGTEVVIIAGAEQLTGRLGLAPIGTHANIGATPK